MPRYKVSINANIIASAKDVKSLRRHINASFKDAWWNNYEIGFHGDIYHAKCNGIDILKIKKEK